MIKTLHNKTTSTTTTETSNNFQSRKNKKKYNKVMYETDSERQQTRA